MQNNITNFPAQGLLCPKQAARYLGASHRTLEDWRLNGAGPRFIKMGRLIRYRREHLDEFVDQCTFRNTGEAEAA
jgi:excisionase family DNA binding protein